MNIAHEYLKAREVAEILKMDVSTIYKLCEERVLPSIRIGQKAVRIPRAGLEAYLAQQSRGWEQTQGEKLVDLAREGWSGTDVTALERQVASFRERAGCPPREFVDRWRSRQIPDTPETADLAIEALGLRNALDRLGISEAVLA